MQALNPKPTNRLFKSNSKCRVAGWNQAKKPGGGDIVVGLPARNDKGVTPLPSRSAPAHYLVSNVRHSSPDFYFACQE